MAYELKTLISNYRQAGRVQWIGLRPARREGVVAVDCVQVTMTGLQGDHGRSGKRAVTMVQAEHLPVIGSFLGRGPVVPETLRRNLVVEGINFSALKGRQVQVGQAVLQVEVICAPCSRMEEAFGIGGYSAVRGHGGWCASVIEPGEIKLGDVVRPVD
ncbi:MAG: MOSC domain-containing protein [Paracoccaceae bacterium]